MLRQFGMIMSASVRYLLVLLLLLPSLGEAAPRGLGFYSDQDLLLPFVNEDRDYTMGVAFEFFNEGEGVYPLDRAARWLGEYMGVHREDDIIHRSYMVGSVNYTPDDLSASAPIVDDRPYASVLFLTNKRVHASGDEAVGVEAQFGILGTYVAREVQRNLHKLWRDISGSDEPVDPKGWRNQISSGGEPTLRLRIAKASRIAQQPGLWDLAQTWSLTLGYQTNASLGLSGRIGQIASPFWTLPYDPINRGNFLPSLGGDEWYLWAVYRARLVGYDALLQGQFRDSVLTYGSGDIKRLVHEGGFGVTGAWRALQLTLAANAKTAELGARQADRTHWWGGLYMTVRF
jgi:hypothetical protein